MKKRLLISSVLMSAVLACALGTGTYAWYTAEQSVNKAATNVTISAATVSTIGDESIQVTFAASGHDANNVVMVDDDGKEKAYVNGTLVPITTNGDKAKYYTVKLTGATLSSEEQSVYAAAAGTYTVTVNASSRLVLHSEAPTEEYVTGGDSIQFQITLTTGGLVTMDAQTIYVVVNGDSGNQTPDNDFGGNLSFSIA